MSSLHAIYGSIPTELVASSASSVQTSPRVPGAQLLSAVSFASFDSLIIYAPENTLERRYVLAQALLALKPGGTIVALAPKNKGGTRLAKELSEFGCSVETSHRRHYKIVECQRPAHILNIDEALKMGAVRHDPALGMWTQPGLFSWNRIDPGSALLLRHLPPCEGEGADLGCGYGLLARAVLAMRKCRKLALIDIDRRALDVAVLNVDKDRIETIWADVRSSGPMPRGLDFVVMNPPFHDAGVENRMLGRVFIEQAAAMLRSQGILWMIANRHLPYEETLNLAFAHVEQITQEQGYKIYKACK